MDDGFDSDFAGPPSEGLPTRWIAINTHPHRERAAVEHLNRQKFAVYCPMELRRIRHARRIQNVTRPLFPGYIFAEVMPHRARWRPILSTYGVRSMIRAGDQPAFIDNAFIEALRSREIDGVIAKPLKAYEVGQQVRLNGGAFDGLVATIIGLGERERLVLLANLLGQKVHLKILARHVRQI